MGGLLEKVESVLDTGKFMNKNSTSHMRKHITIIEDDKALNDGIVLALKNTEFTFTQNYLSKSAVFEKIFISIYIWVG